MKVSTNYKEVKYETDLTWYCEEKGFNIRGNSKKTTLFPIHFDWNYQIVNPYAVYSIVLYFHTVIKNHNATNDFKILCLHDSFSRPISSFIAPQFSELHFLDLRQTKKDLFGIIEKIKPDIVVMMYNEIGFDDHFMTDVNPKDHM